MRLPTLQTMAVWATSTAIVCLLTFAYAHQGTPKDRAENTVCLGNLKQLGLGMLLYSQDYDERFPPITTQPKVQKLVLPYVKKKELFTCPALKAPYVFNKKAVDKYTPDHTYGLAEVPHPAKTVIIHDPKAHSDRTWGVTYMDGHAKREQKLPPLTQQ